MITNKCKTLSFGTFQSFSLKERLTNCYLYQIILTVICYFFVLFMFTILLVLNVRHSKTFVVWHVLFQSFKVTKECKTFGFWTFWPLFQKRETDQSLFSSNHSNSNMLLAGLTVKPSIYLWIYNIIKNCVIDSFQIIDFSKEIQNFGFGKERHTNCYLYSNI